MPTQPLSPSGNILTYLRPFTGAPVHSLAVWTLAAGAVVWTLYSLVIAYHWVRYSHGSNVAVPAIITHIIVSFALAFYAFSTVL